MKFSGKSFTNETIDIDFNDFVDCTFIDCTLVYNGYGAFGLSGCSFQTVSWSFSGAAANTVDFLRGLYHGSGDGGRVLVESTFENIRSQKGEA